MKVTKKSIIQDVKLLRAYLFDITKMLRENTISEMSNEELEELECLAVAIRDKIQNYVAGV